MTELIVALDGPEPVRLALRLVEVGVTWFKVGPRTLTDRNWHDLLGPLFAPRINVFLDLKLADTSETCREAVRRFAYDGVAAISTFTDAATIAALHGAQGTAMRVWRVIQLTDERVFQERSIESVNQAHGVIIPGRELSGVKRGWLVASGKDIVTPGVRLNHLDVGDDTHVWPTAARDCPGLSVTHAVVGRPIWGAKDPVTTALAYMEALS